MFTIYRQYDAMDCGPACLKMIVKYYGKNISLQLLRELCNTSREGSSIQAILNASAKIGLTSSALKCCIEDENFMPQIPFLREMPFPLIAHWNNNHFLVIIKIRNNKVYIADPAKGLIVTNLKNIQKNLYSSDTFAKVIVFEPASFFYDEKNTYFESQLLSNMLKFVSKRITENKKNFLILLFIVFLQLIVQISSPFIAQITFDAGILQKNLNILISVLIVQILIFLFTSGSNFFNSIISNKIAQKINFSLANDFIYKLFKIPLSGYQQKRSSDFIHRIYDLNKIESFITYNLTSITLAIFGFFIFSAIAIYYNVIVYLVFISYSIINATWTIFSLRKRKELDYEKFDIRVNTHRYLTEIIEGIYEIKLNGSELIKIKQLVNNQQMFFVNNLKLVKLSQLLSVGGGLINSLGNGFIMFYTAYLTLDKTITIGEMAAIQLVVNQLSSMIANIISSVTLIQETKFSMERVLEMQSMKDEKIGVKSINTLNTIIFKDITFSYTEISEKVIKKINFTIEAGKTTAIVGASGSGKTTLLKLALGLYSPNNGQILLDDTPMEKYDIKGWRKKCGVIMQDGYLFTDTIMNNITGGGDEGKDYDRYIKSLKLAAIYDFVNTLPLKHETKIGKDGLALSSGQRQRILIARMIYKNPEYIFMDEATNSLDSETERIIMNNLKNIFSNRTILIIAHRLNTVKNADKIIVLRDGKIIEEGTHDELVYNDAYYHKLVKEQIE